MLQIFPIIEICPICGSGARHDRLQPCYQPAEEARHRRAASLTAVRVWPSVERYLAPVVDHDVARNRFIEIVTDYRVAMHAVESRSSQEFRIRARRLLTAIERRSRAIRDGQSTESAEFKMLYESIRDLVDLVRETAPGRSYMVQGYLRGKNEDCSLPPAIRAARNDVVREAMFWQYVLNEFDRGQRKRGPRSRKEPRADALQKLAAWFEEFAGPYRSANGRTASEFLTFLHGVSKALSELASNSNEQKKKGGEDDAPDPGRRLPQSLCLGNSSKAIATAFRAIAPRGNANK